MCVTSAAQRAVNDVLSKELFIMALVAVSVCTLKYKKSNSEHTQKAVSQQDTGFSKHAIQRLDLNCPRLKSVSRSIFNQTINF